MYVCVSVYVYIPFSKIICVSSLGTFSLNFLKTPKYIFEKTLLLNFLVYCQE